MISLKLTTLFIFLILFHSTESISNDENYDDDDIDNDDTQEVEDCQHEINFKTIRKTGKASLCETLEKPSTKSRIQLKIFINHTEEIIHIRVLSSTFLNNTNEKKSLIQLTTDLIEEFKYPTSLLSIDNYQLISFGTFQSILLSLISVDFNLLSRNLKKTLLFEKAQSKQPLLSCYGNYYPKQDVKLLNIKPAFLKPIICTKEPQSDKFFTLQETLHLDQSHEKSFRLAQIHQDDSKKISRTTWYTCSNPKSCVTGLQNKAMLDKTVNYVLKFLEKSRTEKKKA